MFTPRRVGAGFAGAAAILAAIVISSGGTSGGPVIAGPTATATATPTGTPPPVTCNVNTSAASLAALNTATTAATTGQTVCLAQNGDYGTWTGVNKTITVRPGSGITATMGLNLGGGVHNFTLDGNKSGAFTDAGLTITSFDTVFTSDAATNFTLKNMEFGVNGIHLDTVTNIGVTLDHDHWHDILGNPPGVPAAVWVDNTSNVTIKNSLFENMTSDGLNLSGSSITATGNDFKDIYPHGTGLHVDGIQWGGGIPGSVISGNYVYANCEQGLSGFDGSGSMTYEDNVIIGCTAWSGEFGGDRPGSTVDHNTFDGIGDFGCGSKANGVGSPDGPSLTFLRDNFLFGGGGLDITGLNSSTIDCTPSQNLNNLTSTPTFVGGATPTTYAGFALSVGSVGKGTASDAGDVGARVASYPRATGMP